MLGDMNFQVQIYRKWFIHRLYWRWLIGKRCKHILTIIWSDKIKFMVTFWLKSRGRPDWEKSQLSPFDVLVIYALRYLSFNNKQITSGSNSDISSAVGGHDTSRGLKLVYKTGNWGTYSVALLRWTNIIMHNACCAVFGHDNPRIPNRDQVPARVSVVCVTLIPWKLV